MKTQFYPAVFIHLILVLFPLLASADARYPTPPEIWAQYDPDAGDFNEEIVSESVRNGIYYRESYISAYVLGDETRAFADHSLR